MTPLPPPNFTDRARCAETDPDQFFPEQGDNPTAAKRICAGCEVRPECLSYAMTNNLKHGVWGGLSEQQRKRLRAVQRRARVLSLPRPATDTGAAA